MSTAADKLHEAHRLIREARSVLPDDMDEAYESLTHAALEIENVLSDALDEYVSESAA